MGKNLPYRVQLVDKFGGPFGAKFYYGDLAGARQKGKEILADYMNPDDRLLKLEELPHGGVWVFEIATYPSAELLDIMAIIKRIPPLGGA